MNRVRLLARKYMSKNVRSKLGRLAAVLDYYTERALQRRGPASPNVILGLPQGPVGPSRFNRRLCKLCEESDWRGEDWLGLLTALGVEKTLEKKHRKEWEWAQGLYALDQLGLLREDATAVGIGAGTEPVIYYLANRIKTVYATDIYSEGEFANQTAFSNMLVTPEDYSPIPFRKDHLITRYMDGRQLEFPDNAFDFAFSFSSIEHFGSHENSGQAVREMGRVVKPGGAVVITTEAVLNGESHDEYFRPEDIDQYLVRNTGLRLIEDIDYTISAKTLADIVDCRLPHYAHTVPHIVLKFRNVCWTSVCLVMEKV